MVQWRTSPFFAYLGCLLGRKLFLLRDTIRSVVYDLAAPTLHGEGKQAREVKMLRAIWRKRRMCFASLEGRIVPGHRSGAIQLGHLLHPVIVFLGSRGWM